MAGAAVVALEEVLEDVFVDVLLVVSAVDWAVSPPEAEVLPELAEAVSDLAALLPPLKSVTYQPEPLS